MTPMERDPERRETTLLWLAILVLCLASAYRMACGLSPGLRELVEPVTTFSGSQWVVNGAFLYLVALLWLSYRRWSDTISRRHELERIIDSIGPDVLLVVNPDRDIEQCRGAIERMFGYVAREVVGRKTDLLYFDRRQAGGARDVFRQLEDIGFHVGEARGKNKDGTEFPLEIITGNLAGQQGAVVLIRDIADRKEAEQRLVEAHRETQAAYIRLKELEELRDNLTHMIVHDLKSPVASITGYAGLLRRVAADRLESDQLGYVEEMFCLSNRLTEMINSVLDVSRLESGEMPISRVECEIETIARQAVSEIGPEAGEKDVRIEASAERLTVECDRDIIRRVILNLVGNAVKFTRDGGRIAISLQGGDDMLTFSVTDSGPGIPKEHHERIFERFGQVDARKFSTGLGLTFCRLAVEAHGGRIGVESEEGRGSRFWFALPVKPAAPG